MDLFTQDEINRNGQGMEFNDEDY